MLSIPFQLQDDVAKSLSCGKLQMFTSVLAPYPENPVCGKKFAQSNYFVIFLEQLRQQLCPGKLFPISACWILL